MDKKSSYKNILNNLIAADDLHWNDEENKYNAISKDELDEILMSCIAQGITSDKDCFAIVNWATEVKVGIILLNNFIKRKIIISSIDKKGEPSFVPNNK